MTDLSHGFGDYAEIARLIGLYVDGARAGDSGPMRQVFSEEATICGFLGPDKFAGPIEMLFAFVDGAGPSPDIAASIRSIQLLDGIASAVVEAHQWSGHSFEDILSFVRFGAEWKIVAKAFRLAA
ncbi:nuclear transport factor 2 family protein [Sphingomonas histidinilytica]|uniref:Putative lumazine-binding n=1 Tax=Rhizorhabdus histidinilytica TaxID=439228 RepID=A0A1T5GPE2_9SPHN|nr:nuclear transport factor 2 family protein [Rhizorhabdus histidinilytica]MBO9380350.1 nuclear transport factor 2 family protein [Rhizorhabdus histidinilytica]QEH77026.1 nuclear transport factor 2 family protein [Sphingomonas sp. C8-2]SKC10257.1 Putative lumazine-binding [Rhizorhabdus histidinilytica]